VNNKEKGRGETKRQ